MARLLLSLHLASTKCTFLRFEVLDTISQISLGFWHSFSNTCMFHRSFLKHMSGSEIISQIFVRFGHHFSKYLLGSDISQTFVRFRPHFLNISCVRFSPKYPVCVSHSTSVTLIDFGLHLQLL